MPLIPYNDAPLAYFKARGYTRDAIDTICKELDTKHYFSRAEFSRERGLSFTISTHMHKDMQGHAKAILDFLNIVMRLEDIPFNEGSFIVLHEDLAWDDFQKYSREVPIFAFSRAVSDPYTFLMPDPAFLDSGAYDADLKKHRSFEEKYPFDKKTKKVFWRGTKSAGPYSPDIWKGNLRAQLALRCRDYGRTDVFDAFISSLVPNCDPVYADQIREEKILRDYVPLEEFLQYAYQLDIDGVGNAWISYFLKLSSLCPVIKVYSDLEQWFYRSLTPWKHFIPVRKNLSDLIEVIEALPSLENIESIALNANKVMSEISYASEAATFALTAQSLLTFQRR